MELLGNVVEGTLVLAVGLILGVLGKGRFKELERRFTEVDRRFDKVDARFDKVDARIDAFRASLDAMRSDLTAVALAVGARPKAGNA